MVGNFRTFKQHFTWDTVKSPFKFCENIFLYDFIFEILFLEKLKLNHNVQFTLNMLLKYHLPDPFYQLIFFEVHPSIVHGCLYDHEFQDKSDKYPLVQY